MMLRSENNRRERRGRTKREMECRTEQRRKMQMVGCRVGVCENVTEEG